MMNRLFAAALAAGLSTPARGADPPVLSLVHENDWFGGTDEGYTAGVKLAWVSAEGRGRALARLLLGADDADAVRFGVAGAQSIFTPRDTLIAAPLPGQHPYAGWLAIEAMSVVERRAGPIDILKVSAGVVGPASLAEGAQRTVHRIIDTTDVLGWENQLRNEPALLVSFDRTWRPVNGAWFRVEPHAGVSIGNVLTEARSGARLRIGAGLSGAGATRISPSFPSGGYYSVDGFSWEIFAGAMGRAVARNIFLDGNTFRDSLSVDKKHLVGEVEAGFAVGFGGVRLAYAHVFRTREFDTQFDRSSFGAVTLSAAF